MLWIYRELYKDLAGKDDQHFARLIDVGWTLMCCCRPQAKEETVLVNMTVSPLERKTISLKIKIMANSGTYTSPQIDLLINNTNQHPPECEESGSEGSATTCCRFLLSLRFNHKNYVLTVTYQYFFSVYITCEPFQTTNWRKSPLFYYINFSLHTKTSRVSFAQLPGQQAPFIQLVIHDSPC